MQPPSKRWKSLRLAVLDSLANKFGSYAEMLSIPFFAAVGFYLQAWVHVTFMDGKITSDAHAMIVLAAALSICLFAPALLAMLLATRTVQRMMHGSRS